MPTILLCLISFICGGLCVIAFQKLRQSSIEKSGQRGEQMASGVIQHILADDDILLANIEITSDGRRTELDNVVVNKNGVFIIEVKNYHGKLIGREFDREWIKKKKSSGGRTYVSKVKNPIRQVRRQREILSDFLAGYGLQTPVKGYVLLVKDNSPVKSKYVVSNLSDIDKALHPKNGKPLNQYTVNYIAKCIRSEQEQGAE